MTQSQILIHQISFNLPNGKSLFTNLNHTFAKQKIGLIGNNGIGKSTLIKLITNELQPTTGAILESIGITRILRAPFRALTDKSV